MVQRELDIHALQAPVFFLEFIQSLDVGGFHATLLRLPLVIGGFADLMLATGVCHLLSRFHCFQDGDDLVALNLLFRMRLLAYTRPGTSTSMVRFLGRPLHGTPIGTA